jgi:hypothetical protein
MKITKHLKTAGIALLASQFLFVSAPATAGMNGQQLQVTTRGNTIKITGPNQNGQIVTWQSSNSSGINKVYTTYNWWWKGTVSITVTLPDNSQRTCSVSVPTWWGSNLYGTSCESYRLPY